MAFNQRDPCSLNDVHQSFVVRADTNDFQANGRTRLMDAVLYHKTYEVRNLLVHGADPKIGTKAGVLGLPIFSAIELGYDDILQLFFDFGGDISLLQPSASNYLRAAINAGYSRVIHILLNHGLDPNFCLCDRRYHEPLLNAVVRLQIYDVVLRLVNLKANLEAIDYEHRTCLFFAVFNCDLTIVKILLESGASANVCDSNGIYLLSHAIRTRYIPVMIELIFANANMDLMDSSNKLGNGLQIAIATNQFDLFRLLIDCRADINFRNSRGESVLDVCLICLSHGFFDTVTCAGILRDLFDKGADITNMISFPFINENFYNHGNEYLLQLLLDQCLQIKTDFQDDDAKPPLHTALNHHDPGFLHNLIVYHHLDIEMKDRNGNTCFMHAAMLQKISAMKLLMQLGAKVSCSNNANVSALEYTIVGSEVTESFQWLYKHTNTNIILRVLASVTASSNTLYQEFILKGLALSEIETPIENISNLLNTISSVCYHYFNSCLTELRQLQCIIVDGISLYQIFWVTKKSLMARNDLIHEFLSRRKFLIEFPVYGFELKTKFIASAVYQNLIKRATKGLCKLTCFDYESNHIIIEKICSFLQPDDLLSLGSV